MCVVPELWRIDELAQAHQTPFKKEKKKTDVEEEEEGKEEE